MDNLTPELNEWSRLYQAVIRIKEIAPWDWMSETDVFGVQDPETGEIGFVSVMGTLGEHYAVAVYLGAEGLYGFWDFQDAGPLGDFEDLLRVPQLQASFEDRGELTKKDRDVIKALGLKFRGRQAWPLLRSFRPGYFPWYLEAQEVRFLAHALEQTQEVAPRFREEPALLTPGDEESYLVRVSREEGGTLVWGDQVVSVPPVEPVSIPIPMDLDALEVLKRVPRSQARLEMDFFMFPARIGERGARPSCAYKLLIVEAASGMVLGTELLEPDPTFEAMYGLIPMTVVRQLARLGIVPSEVKVRTALLYQLMEVLVEDLRFNLEQAPVLPALDSAKEFLLQRFA